MKVYKVKGFVRFQRRERIADKHWPKPSWQPNAVWLMLIWAVDSSSSVSRARDKERAAGFGR